MWSTFIVARIFFFSIPFLSSHYGTLALRPSCDSDPGPHSGPSPPPPHYGMNRAFIFIATRIEHFLSPSTRVES